MFLDILRAGGSVQGHVIYHPNSYFPRSTHVNLTVDVLGASINVLEAAARFEGFEILIEQFFGRDGYYPDDRIMDMFNNLKPHDQRGEEEKPIRGKRSIDDLRMNRVETHLNEIHAKVNVLQLKKAIISFLSFFLFSFPSLLLSVSFIPSIFLSFFFLSSLFHFSFSLKSIIV